MDNSVVQIICNNCFQVTETLAVTREQYFGVQDELLKQGIEKYMIAEVLARRVEELRLLLHDYNIELVPNIIRKYNFRSKHYLVSNKHLFIKSRMQPAKPPAKNPTRVTTRIIEIGGSNTKLDITRLNINSTAQEHQFDSNSNDFKDTSLVDSIRYYT
jgi:hypothetical protein